MPQPLPQAFRAANFTLRQLSIEGVPSGVPALNEGRTSWDWWDLADAGRFARGTLDDARLSDNIPRKVDGKIQASDLPSIALVEPHVVNSEAAMLALDAQTGDVAIRTDISKSFILATGDPAVLANWKELLAPATWVSSVDLSLPSIFSVTGNPITSSGTLTATLNNQSANRVWAGPSSGADSSPTFRALAPADLPAADGTNQGAMSATHYTLVNNATAVNTASALVRRDASGNIAVTAATLDSATGAVLLTFAGDSTTGIGRLSAGVLSLYGGGNRGIDITASQVSLNALTISNSNIRVVGGIRVGGTAGPVNTGAGGLTGTFLNLGDVSTNAILYVGGNKTAPSWTAGGIGLSIPVATYTDNSAAGTVAFTAAHAIGAPIFTSTNARTHTDAATWFIAGAPAGSGNTTITNAWGLYIAAGVKSFLGGNILNAGYAAFGPGATLADTSSSWSQLVVRDTNANVGIKLISSNANGSIQLGTNGIAINRTLTVGELGTAGNLILSGTNVSNITQTWRAQDNTSTFRDQAVTTCSWVSNVTATRTVRMIDTMIDFGATREIMRREVNGSAPLIGFLGANAVGRQTVSAAATDLTTAVALVNDLRTAMINFGFAA